mgnify:FL=1
MNSCTVLLLALLLAACDPEEVQDRDFKPAPSPATCLVIEEVLVKPTTGPASGWQWVNVYNRCATSLPLGSVAIRWTKDGEWVSSLGLAPAKAIPGYGCLTIGGSKSSPNNASPTFTMASAFAPQIPAPSSSGAVGVGLFVTGSTLPFAGVIFGDENLEGIEGIGGAVLLDTDLSEVDPGHSMRLYAGRWTDARFPEPQNCGLY